MLALSLLAVLGASAAIQADPNAFQVMSFNIRYGTADDGEDRWEVRRSRTIEALKKRRPGFIGFQEALHFQIEELKRGLGGYRSVGKGRDDGDEEGEYSAILYDEGRFQVLGSETFWLSETPTVPGSTSWGNHITRICTWAFFKDTKTGKHFYLFNTHLDHESQPSREKGVALILQKIKTRANPFPVLLTGDFNAGEDNQAVKVAKAAFQDTFRIVHPDAKDVGTFTAFGEKPGADKIDYVFADSGFKVLDAEIVKDKVGGRWISDHLPVVATVVQN